MPHLLLSIAAAAQVAVPGVPADCSAYATVMDAQGARSTFAYTAGAAATTPVAGQRLGFRPVAVASLGGAGGGGTSFSSEIAVRGDGSFVSVYRESNERPDGTFDTDLQTRKIGDFPGTRAVATGDGYLYRLTGKGLFRHRYKSQRGTKHFVLGAKQTVRTRGFAPYKTLASFPFDRGSGSVLNATTSGGALRELVVGREGRLRSDRVLQASGYGDVKALTAGFCDNDAKSRTILTHHRNGDLRLRYEPVADGDGSDITPAGVAATGVTGFVYR